MKRAGQEVVSSRGTLEGPGFRVSGLGFRVWGLGLVVLGLLLGSGSGVWYLGLGVRGLLGWGVWMDKPAPP